MDRQLSDERLKEIATETQWALGMEVFLLERALLAKEVLRLRAEMKGVDRTPKPVVASEKPKREYLSPEECAEVYGGSKWTWRQRAYRGAIATVKNGSRLMFARSELDKYMAKNTRPAVKGTK